MSLASFATLLCLLAVVSAETNPTLKETLCKQCMSAEEVMTGVVTTVIETGSTAFPWFGERCESLPEDFKGPCGDFVFQMKETYDSSSKQFIETGMVPCETILQCEPELKYKNYPVDNADLCNPCKALVGVLYSKLGIETLVGEGKDTMIQVCSMLQISVEDCQMAIDEAVERLVIPTPEQTCKRVGVCPKWAVAT